VLEQKVEEIRLVYMQNQQKGVIKSYKLNILQ